MLLLLVVIHDDLLLLLLVFRLRVKVRTHVAVRQGIGTLDLSLLLSQKLGLLAQSLREETSALELLLIESLALRAIRYAVLL